MVSDHDPDVRDDYDGWCHSGTEVRIMFEHIKSMAQLPSYEELRLAKEWNLERARKSRNDRDRDRHEHNAREVQEQMEAHPDRADYN